MSEWFSFSMTKDILLVIVAVYGAVLATFNYRQAKRKDQRNVLVEISTVLPTYGPVLGACFAKVAVINAGQRSVTITNIGLCLPDHTRLFSMSSGMPGMPNTQLPAPLSDGESAHITVSYKDLGEALLSHRLTGHTKLMPICIDSAGALYSGKRWSIDPHKFARM